MHSQGWAEQKNRVKHPGKIKRRGVCVCVCMYAQRGRGMVKHKGEELGRNQPTLGLPFMSLKLNIN